MGHDEQLLLGVDLGGTKMEAVLLKLRSESFEILSRIRRSTDRSLGYAHILHAVHALICETANEAGASFPLRVGVGMPGSISRSSGLIKNANTTCLNGRPFRADLIELLGQPVQFQNDANCFALAEARLGAGKGHSVVFGVILGTGVGGGLVLPGPDGVPMAWDGPQGIAGEWGHVCLEPVTGPPCYCGRRGCVETFLSGPAVEAQYATQTGLTLALRELSQRRETDPLAKQILAEHAAMLGRSLATVINIVDPEIIVLGGGVSNLPGLCNDALREARKWVFSDDLTTPIVRHTLGDSAGVLGAALL
jgi:fructokinase